MTDARWPGWPFQSSDPRMVPQPAEQQEPALCECHGDGVELEEIADNKCATCGKPLIVEVPASCAATHQPDQSKENGTC